MPRSYGNFESPFWVFSRPPALTSLPVSPVWLPGAVNKVCKHPESCRDAAERSGWRPWLRSVPTAGRLVLSGWERRLGPPTSGRGGLGKMVGFPVPVGGSQESPHTVSGSAGSGKVWGSVFSSCIQQPLEGRWQLVSAFLSPGELDHLAWLICILVMARRDRTTERSGFVGTPCYLVMSYQRLTLLLFCGLYVLIRKGQL